MKYNFGSESVLQRVEVITTEMGAKRAYLEASTHADASKLAEIREGLSKHGYITTAIDIGGKPYLEIRRFSSADSLIKQLTNMGAISAPPAQIDTESNRIGAWQWLKNNTFKACLSFYLIGDAGYYFYGKSKEKFGGEKTAFENKKRLSLGQSALPIPKDNPFDKYASFSYAAGTSASVLSTALRGDQSDEEVSAIAGKIRDKISEDNSNNLSIFANIEDERKQGFFSKLVSFFSKHPAEILNLCFSGAGLFMVLASRGHYHESKQKITSLNEAITTAEKSAKSNLLKHLKDDLASAQDARKVSIQDIVLGSITLSSGVISSLIQEKPKTPDEPELEGIFAKAWRWVQEKPLRIAGGGLMVSTLIHIGSTLKDYGRIGKDHDLAQAMIQSGNPLGHEKLSLAKRERTITHGRMVFCVTNIAAEILMMLSSKGHGEGVKSDASVETSAIAMAAEAIAMQAPEKHEALVQELAQHMASPKIMGGSNILIARDLRAHIATILKNPWANITAANEPIYHKSANAPAYNPGKSNAAEKTPDTTIDAADAVLVSSQKKAALA